MSLASRIRGTYLDGYVAVAATDVLPTDSIIDAIAKVEAKADAAGGGSVDDAIVDGVTDRAPSQNAVFDALTGKEAAGAAAAAEASANAYTDAAVAGVGGATNLGYTASPTNGTVTSDTGTDATLTLADGTNAGLMAPAQHTKLGSITAAGLALIDDANAAAQRATLGLNAATQWGYFPGTTTNTPGTLATYPNITGTVVLLSIWASSAVPSDTAVTIYKNGVSLCYATMLFGTASANSGVLALAITSTDSLTASLTSGGAQNVGFRLDITTT